MGRRLLRKQNSEGFVEVLYKGRIKICINPTNFDVYSPTGYIVKWSISNGYEVCKIGFRLNGKRITYHILKHRLIVFLFGDKYEKTIKELACAGSKADVVDHIDSNGLNNSSDNLQIVSRRYNSSREKSLKSGLPTGVVWHKRDKKYMAYIKIDGKTTFIGYYMTIEEANAAYQNRLNQITL